MGACKNLKLWPVVRCVLRTAGSFRCQNAANNSEKCAGQGEEEAADQEQRSKVRFFKGVGYFLSYSIMPSFLFLYFWCQTSPVSPRAPDPGWFSESRAYMVRLTPKV